MYIGFKHLHSTVAYLALLLLLVAFFYTLYGWLTKKEFTKRSKSIVLFGLIATHVQLVVGFVLYFLSPLGVSNFSGEMMKNSVSRLYAVEHPLMMLLGIVLITIGYSKSKRATDAKSKYRTVAIFYGIGLVLILSRIPWNSWWG